jgi:hypothetical protein
VSYVVIPGAGNNSISDDAQYWRAVGDGGK